MIIDDANSRLILNALAEGDIVLILGAGASATCTVHDSPIKQAPALSRLIAEKAGLVYANETLPEVLGATKGRRLSEKQVIDILKKEYSKAQSSPELTALFGYTWYRVYTWNVDDSIENAKGGVQTRRFFNGMKDKVSAHEGSAYLHVVHLHGEAIKPEHGFIFGLSEYNARLNKDDHDWYRATAEDYIAHVPIFIGSKLTEPILAAELDRARPQPDAGLGVAFLVTPDDFSQVQLENFAARNIVVLKGTLADFVGWLRSKMAGVTPADVAKNTNPFADEFGTSISRADIATADSIIRHTWQDAYLAGQKLQGLERSKAARSFLEGGPPSWKLAATDVPVWLQNTNELYSEMIKSIDRRDRFFIVYGQSGSGKTTAIYQSLLRYSKDRNKPIYELRGDVRSLRSSLNLLRKLHKDENVIVYIGDAFLYGDSLAEDASALPRGSVTLITSARTGEWREHIQRRIGEHANEFEFQRFTEPDFEPLIARLVEYVPSPLFRRMSDDRRRARFTSSRSQLLIALKEATHSTNFANVIAEEFRRLPDDDCRALALLVGVSTIARVGISAGAARESYKRLRKKREFNEALLALGGIVLQDKAGRFIVRHELYIRHIIDHVAPLHQTIGAIIEVLRTFTKYNLPIVKTVGRLDALLFKFLLNHNFTAELCQHHGSLVEGLRIYQAFEVDFQLDGHFWLQYGQFLVRMGRLEEALPVLSKSIEAYPSNVFAAHAYADLQLRVATERPSYDSLTIALIDEAVRSLERNMASREETDRYPLVTLSERHVGVLVKHGQNDEARKFARKYFKALEEAIRQKPTETLEKTREKLAHFLTFGRWS